MGTFEAPQADSPSDEPEHRKRQAASGTPSAPYVSGNMSLDHAAAGWTRRGFTLRYADPYLAQVVRREGLRARDMGLLALAGAVALGCVALTIAIMRGRPWRVVTLVARPDGRIQMHQQVTEHPPQV